MQIQYSHAVTLHRLAMHIVLLCIAWGFQNGNAWSEIVSTAVLENGVTLAVG